MASSDDIALFEDAQDAEDATTPVAAPMMPRQVRDTSADDIAMFSEPKKTRTPDPRFVDDTPETRPFSPKARAYNDTVAGIRTDRAALSPAPLAVDAHPSVAASYVAGLRKAASFGYGDEFEGAVKTLVDGGRSTYVDNRDAVRARDRKIEGEHPIAAGAGELTGGVATALIPGVGVAKGATAGQVAMQAAKQGAVYGGGTSEADLTKGEVGQFAQDVGVSAAANAALAGGTAKLVRGAPERVDSRILKAIDRGEAGGAAKDKLANNLTSKAGENGEVLNEVLERTNLKKSVSTQGPSAPGKVERKVTAVIDKITSARLDPIYEKIDAGPATTTAIGLQTSLQKVREKLVAQGNTGMADVVERYQSHIAKHFGADGNFLEKKLPASTLRNMKGEVGEVAFSGDQMAASTPFGKRAKQMIYGAINDAIEEAGAKTPGVNINELRAANSDVSVLIAARDTLADRAAKDARGRTSLWHALTSSHLAAGALTGLAGTAHGGSTEGLITGALAAGALKVAPPAARRADWQLSKMALAARRGSVPAQLGQAATELGVSRVAGDELARHIAAPDLERRRREEADRELARRLQAQGGLP